MAKRTPETRPNEFANQSPLTKKGTPRKRPGMPGAGRPKGSRDKKTLKTMLRIMDGDIKRAAEGKPLPPGTTPLDVMMAAMDTAHRLGGPIAAFPYAKEAAPFMHPKMASMEWKNPSDPNAGPPRLLVEFVTAQKPPEPTK